MLKRFVMFTSMLALSGCATIFTGTTCNVQLNVVDVDTSQLLDDVKCSVTDNDGMVYLTSTNPGNIIVSKGKGTLRVNCKKPGYVQQNMGIAQNFNGVTIVNVLFWPGIIVDVVTGSVHKYPPRATILMKKETEQE